MKIIRYFYLIFIAFTLGFTANAQEVLEATAETSETATKPEAQKKYGAVRFRALNKITTKTEEFTSAFGSVMRFGNLEIIARGCWVAPPNKRPEQAGLLETWYWKPGEKPSLVFFGWMFESSPALSSLEHPIYDITMLECIKKAPKSKDPEPSKAVEKTEGAPAE